MFSNCDLVKAQLLGSERERQAKEKGETFRGKAEMPKANYQGSGGRCNYQRGGNSVWMKQEGRTPWVWSKCYVLKNLKAEIEKKNQKRQEKLLQMEVATSVLY